MAISKENTRPESMARITTPELAKAFIDEQVSFFADGQVGAWEDGLVDTPVSLECLFPA